LLVPTEGGVALVAAGSGVTVRNLDASAAESAGEVTFEDAVPKALLPAEAAERIVLAGAAGAALILTGASARALELAVEYAKVRMQFGQPIGAFQAVQHMLADMATELAAARALMLGVARTLDAGGEARADASMAKLFCSETAFRIADRAVQVLGGEGIVQGSRVEFLFRLLRMYRVLTGTSEIQRNTIARELLGAAGR
jgi:alkylation response protein AidB-like acyl-CoA dehydrogenase